MSTSASPGSLAHAYVHTKELIGGGVGIYVGFAELASVTDWGRRPSFH